MRFKQNIKYVAVPAKVFVTVAILLLAVIMLQGILVETVRLFDDRDYKPPQVVTAEPNEQEKKLRRMSKSPKGCLPDGTVHLLIDSSDNRDEKDKY
ncbi:MAG: hypothetical protein ACYS8Z_16905, partial [Planctomycetota bacterium]